MKNEINDIRKLDWIDTRGFLQSNFHKDAFSNKLTVQQTLDYIDTLYELCEGKPIPILIDCRDILDDIDANVERVLFENNKLSQIRKAEAFIVNSLSMRLKLNFYPRIYKSHSPIKVFNNELDAIDWLLKF